MADVIKDIEYDDRGRSITSVLCTGCTGRTHLRLSVALPGAMIVRYAEHTQPPPIDRAMCRFSGSIAPDYMEEN